MTNAVAVPTGPFDAIRQGWRIYRAGRGVVTGQIALLILFFLVVLGVLAATGIWSPQRPPALPMGQAGFSFGVSVALFAVSLVDMVLQMGILHSLGELAEGRPVRVADLGWGMRRGEVWLLATIIGVINLILNPLSARMVVASGFRVTGNPHHPFTVVHGPWMLLGVLGFLCVLLLLVGNTLLLAMATASRYGQSALTSLRTALKSFAPGFRRFLWINLCLILVWLGIGLAAGIVVGLFAFLLHALGMGAPGAKAVVGILGFLAMVAFMVVVIIFVFVAFGVTLGTFAAASAALQEGNAR